MVNGSLVPKKDGVSRRAALFRRRNARAGRVFRAMWGPWNPIGSSVADALPEQRCRTGPAKPAGP